MPSEEKKIWGIHTKDDNLFLHQDVIAIGWKATRMNCHLAF